MKKISVFASLFMMLCLTGMACKKTAKKEVKKVTKKVVKKPTTRKAMKKTFHFNPKATKIAWTAYKYTRKAAVNGYFATFTASGTTKGSSALEILKGIQLEIKTDSVKTGNPARDVSIATNFFKKFTGGPIIHAKVIKVEGKEKGKLHVKLKLHGLEQTVAFAYTLTPEGKLDAQATIDMLKFGLKKPFKALHKTCRTLHKGKDGKSKTWTDVKLRLTTQMTVK